MARKNFMPQVFQSKNCLTIETGVLLVSTEIRLKQLALEPCVYTILKLLVFWFPGREPKRLSRLGKLIDNQSWIQASSLHKVSVTFSNMQFLTMQLFIWICYQKSIFSLQLMVGNFKTQNKDGKNFSPFSVFFHVFKWTLLVHEVMFHFKSACIVI